MKRLFRALGCALLALVLTGCTSGGKTISFTWFADQIPSNLDPQLAQTSAEMIACKHLYTGLYQLDESGELQPGCASAYSLSPDGCTYTFTIRPDLYYQAARGETTSYAITAEDFVFAFQRLFRPETKSPYAPSFLSVAGASDVLAGADPASVLGVSAPDPYTLVIQLDAPDPGFVEKLTLPGAMPCDQEYFESTQGTYGLTKKTFLSNGEFYLYNWTGDGLFLRREPNGTAVNSLRLVTNTNPVDTSPIDLVENEKCTAVTDLGNNPTELHQIPYSNTTWCLRFNGKSIFANDALRQAMTSAAQTVPLPDNQQLYGAVEGIVPNGASVDLMDYRSRVGNLMPAPVDAAALWQQAVAQLKSGQLKGLSLLVPESADRDYVQNLNSTWQKQFGLFLNVETVDDETFARRCSGKKPDFTVALMPVQLTIPDPTLLLTQLADQLPEGGSSYVNQIPLPADAAQGGARIDALGLLEQQLIESCYFAPLYCQNARLLVDPSVTGLQFDPFGPTINVTWAHRSE